MHVHDVATTSITRQKQTGDIGELGEGPDMNPCSRSAKGGSKETRKSTYSRHRSRQRAEQATATARTGAAAQAEQESERPAESASLLGAAARGSCWDLWALGFGRFIYGCKGHSVIWAGQIVRGPTGPADSP